MKRKAFFVAGKNPKKKLERQSTSLTLRRRFLFRPSISLSPVDFSFAPHFLPLSLPHRRPPLVSTTQNGRRRLPQRRLVARRGLVRRPQALAARDGARRGRDGRRRVQGLLDVGEARDAPRRPGQADPVQEVVRRAGGEDRGRRGDEPGEVDERRKREKKERKRFTHRRFFLFRPPPVFPFSLPFL